MELKDIMSYEELHYFDVGTNDTPKIVLGGVVTEISESSNPVEQEKQYVHQKSKTVKTTGFSNEFPITMDMVKGDEVFEDFYQKFSRRKVGSDLLIDHYIINTWEPGTESETYKARKITQTVSITECTNVAGEQKTITGSLKGGDFEYGEFNLSTKTFTPEV